MDRCHVLFGQCRHFWPLWFTWSTCWSSPSPTTTLGHCVADLNQPGVLLARQVSEDLHGRMRLATVLAAKLLRYKQGFRCRARSPPRTGHSRDANWPQDNNTMSRNPFASGKSPSPYFFVAALARSFRASRRLYLASWMTAAGRCWSAQGTGFMQRDEQTERRTYRARHHWRRWPSTRQRCCRRTRPTSRRAAGSWT